MTNMRAYQTGLTSLLTHVLAIPAYTLVFLLVYQSVWMIDWLGMGVGDARLLQLNMLIVCCIELGVLCASRIPMTACKIRMSWLYYVLWILGEVVASSLLVGLYMTLMYGGMYSYFACVGKSLMMLIAILATPYVIVNLIISLKKEEKPEVREDSLVRFCDFTERLKLVIAAGVILYIEAEENYCHVHYLEGDKPKDYLLRNSMTRLQPLMTKHGIVRCQRSFFVNPQHVKVLRKDKEGVIVAELDVVGVRSIPVSPKYYDVLNEALS